MSYHFSPEQVADYSEPICWDGNQLGQLSSKSTPAKSLPSDSGTESCQAFPSGIWTSETSTPESLTSIAHWLTSLSLVPDSPANHSQPPGSNSEPTTQEICGRQRLTPFASYDREGSCWRTSQLSLLTNTSESFKGTWPKAGIVSDGDAYRQPKWERRISEIGYGGLVPTPRALEHGNYTYDRGDHSKPRSTLSGWVKLFPTPTVAMVSGGANHDSPSVKAGKHGLNLAAEVHLRTAVSRYPSPATRDWRSGSGRQDNGHSPQLPEVVGGQLNPDWVEWLMGWPVGWTSLEPLNREGFDLWVEKMRSGTWWKADPADEGLVPRLAQDVPSRVARLKALGNGQVPAVVCVAYLMISSAL